MRGNSTDAIGGTAHGAHVRLVKADSHAEVGGEEDQLRAVSDAGDDELIVLVNADGDDAAGHDVGEVPERGFLDRSLLRGEEDEFAFLLEIADGEDGADIFAWLQVEQALHGLTLACRTYIGNFVDLEPVDAAGVGEAEQVGMGGVDDELGDEVLFAGLHAGAAGAPATLGAIDRDGRPLEVTLVADGDSDLLVGDEVFKLELGAFIDNLGAARVPVLVAHFFKLGDDDGAELGFAGKDGLVLGYALRGPA